MAARITFDLLAIFLIQFFVCAPPPAATANPLDVFQKSADDFFSDLKSDINSLISTSSRKIKEVYQENSSDLVSDFTRISKVINEKFEGVREDLKHSIQLTSIAIGAAINDLKSKHPVLDDIKASIKK